MPGTANELDQSALRLAAKLVVYRVDAVDWNEMPPGAIADFDFTAWAEAHGQQDRVEMLRKRGQAQADAPAARMRCTPIAAWYRPLTPPPARHPLHRHHYAYALIGDCATDPGALRGGHCVTP